MADSISIRLLPEHHLDEADRVFRLAFGTFLNLPDPMQFAGDTDSIRTRWKTDPTSAFAAYSHDTLVGLVIAVTWGSVGFFGPLTVRPDYWDHGIGARLLEPVMEFFAKRFVRNAGLFTFPDSPKHLGLYQKFDFWPGHLTAVMAKAVSRPETNARWTVYSEGSESERRQLLHACAGLTEALYPGLDVGVEIRAIHEQGIGDTVLLWEDEKLCGLAVCHCGPKSEAGSNSCYIKFGAVRPGPHAARRFTDLLHACEAFAAGKSLGRIFGGVNTIRHEAYRAMLAMGFRTDFQGVLMHRRNDPGYSHPGSYIIDDWR